jgi:hypothetical protein
MVARKFTAGTYHIDVVRGEQGITYDVMRCELVASFDDEQHAAFLVELLLKEQQ